MLDIEVFMSGMQKLNTAFPQHRLNKEQTELYYERLNHMSFEEFKYAINNVIDTSKFMPTIAVILEQLEKLNDTNEDKARNFESNVFKYDTDTTIRHFKRIGDKNAVEVIQNNYKILREAKLTEIPTIKAQLRNQYIALVNRESKQQVIKNNNLQLMSKRVKQKVLGADIYE